MTTYPIDQNILPVHPAGFRTGQESHRRCDLVHRSNTFQRVRVRNGRDELFRLSFSEKCSIDGTCWLPHVSRGGTGRERAGAVVLRRTW